MNATPYTVYPLTPVPQVFNLFRSMGLRHVPVVDHFGQVLFQVITITHIIINENTPMQYTAIFHDCKKVNFKMNFFIFFLYLLKTLEQYK